MTVKRYGDTLIGIKEMDDGKWVSHEDYAALLKERGALISEVAALKSAHPQPFGREMMKALDAYEKYQDEVPETGMLDAFFILRDSIKVQTPATDAAIENLQAQGVEMLADHLSGLNIMASETSVREFAAQLRKESTHD